MTQSTDPNELRTYAFKLRRNNPESWSHKAAADTLDECALRIEKTEAEVEALRKQLAEQPAAPAICTWHQDCDSDSGLYGTSCKHYFNVEDGTPEDNKMQWCCYCGKKLAQELITDDEAARPGGEG